MSFFEAVALALIQGLTEFLPISSSAHLILPSQVLGWQDQGLAFDVAVHVGTLTAVISYFRREIVSMFKAWCRSIVTRKNTSESCLAWAVIIGTLPAGIAGLIFNDFIEQQLRSAWVIAFTTIIFGLLLWWADSRAKSNTRNEHAIRWRDVWVVGFAQALALIPGTSRSGITMTAGLMMGLDRSGSARYSFLLSIPLILAAGGLKTKELIEANTTAQWDVIILGTIVSAVSAYICIYYFLKFIQRIGLMPFVIYRLVLGVGLFLFLFMRSGSL